MEFVDQKSASDFKTIISEKRVAFIRLTLSVFVPAIYWLGMDAINTDQNLALVATVIAVSFSSFVVFFKPYQKIKAIYYCYLASFADIVIAVLWIFATGGMNSLFFILMPLAILAIAFRSGQVHTLFSGVFFSLFYTLIFFSGGVQEHLIPFVINVFFLLTFTIIGMIISSEIFKQTRIIIREKKYVKEIQETYRDLKSKFAAESKLAAIISNSDDAILSKELDGTISSWNPGAEKIFGYNEKEVVGKNIQILIPPDRHNEEPEIIEKIKRGDIIKQYETVRRKKNGQDIAVSVTISPIRDPNGIIIGASSIARDVTERKKTEDILYKFRKALDSSADDIFIIDRDKMVFVDVNEQACISTGYSREELLKLGPHNIKPKFTRENLAEKFDSIINSSQNFGVIQTIHQRKDGSTYEVEVFLKSFSIDGAFFLTASVRNVSARIAMEAELKRTNKFLSSILENIPNMIFVKEAKDLKFIEFNKAGEELTGISRAEILGCSDFDFFPKEEAEYFLRRDREVLEKGEIKKIVEEPIHTQNKGERWLYTKMVPVKDEEGNDLFLLGISQDITEERIAQQEVEELNKKLLEKVNQLKALNQELEAFSYSVSHDLRAPLRALRGYSDILLEDYRGKFSGTGEEYLQEIKKNSLRMNELILNLLEFSKTTRKIVAKKPLNFKNIVEEVLEDLKVQYPNTQVNIKELLVAEADRDLMKQVWTNYLSNAFKYSAKNEKPMIEIGSYKNQNEIVFYVKDNGVGFNMKYSNKLFKVFQRLHTDEEFEGTGIGLAIASKIISRHNGRVWVESTPDKGSVFYFSLPQK
jgi:PAS domain S-box-containing protein